MSDTNDPNWAERLRELKEKWESENPPTYNYHYNFGHGACPCCGRCRCCGNGHGFHPYYPATPWITWISTANTGGTFTSGLCQWQA